jgi:hypothetical protein
VGTPFFFGGFMGVSEFLLRSYLSFFNSDNSDRRWKPSHRFFRNFGICPHCKKTARPFLLDRLNDEEPMISRSDGESFHLVLGDRPICFPAERSAGKTGMVTAGFWYVTERKTDSRKAGESSQATGTTETVVIILRNPPRRGAELTRHLETVADRLADKLAKPEELRTLYEFYGNQLHRVS